MFQETKIIENRLTSMLNRIKSFIETEKLLPEKSLVVVGLSGGADSMVLLHVLLQLGYRCIAAH